MCSKLKMIKIAVEVQPCCFNLEFCDFSLPYLVNPIQWELWELVFALRHFDTVWLCRHYWCCLLWRLQQGRLHAIIFGPLLVGKASYHLACLELKWGTHALNTSPARGTRGWTPPLCFCEVPVTKRECLPGAPPLY